jgi:hypothetical protein
MIIRRALLVGAFALAAFAANNLTGTWKLNVAKSKYTGIPAPKEVTGDVLTLWRGLEIRGQGNFRRR